MEAWGRPLQYHNTQDVNSEGVVVRNRLFQNQDLSHILHTHALRRSRSEIVSHGKTRTLVIAYYACARSAWLEPREVLGFAIDPLRHVYVSAALVAYTRWRLASGAAELADDPKPLHKVAAGLRKPTLQVHGETRLHRPFKQKPSQCRCCYSGHIQFQVTASLYLQAKSLRQTMI